MPGFPADDYGFTLEDRLRWAPYALNYLTNREEISYLADLRFEDGTPLFNERELSHMEDVKKVTRGALNVFYGALAGLALLGLWSKRGEQWQAFRQGLKRGGWIMVGLAGAVASHCAGRHVPHPGSVLGLLQRISRPVFRQAIRGCSSIRTRSSACSPCASGRIRSCSRRDLQWQEDWGWRWELRLKRKTKNVKRNTQYAVGLITV